MKLAPSVLAMAAGLALSSAACDAPDDDGGDDVVGADDGIQLDDGSSDDGSSDDDSSDDDSSDDGSTDDGEPVWCVDETLTVDVSVPQIVLVLDKSHSMVTESWDHDGVAATPEVTRWHSLHDVTMDLVESLDTDIAFGAVLFPSAALTSTDEATACTVEDEPDVAVGLDRAADIRAALPSADELEIHGGTPTRAGIETAVEHLRTLPTDQPRAIVLVTDGAANCAEDSAPFGVYDEALAPVVAAAAAEGIPTYVVGIDIVDEWIDGVGNPHERMSEVALAGGVPREGDAPYYLARDEHALRESIDAIATQIQCRIELAGLPDDPSRVHLSVDDVELTHTESCEDVDDGWRYTGDGAVELCSASCDSYGLSGAIQARFDCEPEG